MLKKTATSDRAKYLIPFSKRLSFILLFSIASAIAIIVAGIIISLISRFLPTLPSLETSAVNLIVIPFISGAIAGLINGATIGIAQWLILRRYISNGVAWIWLTAVGSSLWTGLATAWVVGFFSLALSALSLSYIIAILFSPIVIEIVAAIAIGFAQWILLRKIVKKAFLWMAVYPIAKAIGFLCEQTPKILSSLFPNPQFLEIAAIISSYLSILIFWAIVPAIALCLFQRRVRVEA
jgi:hypothetical protein